MKIDIVSKPPPLGFGEGEGAFALLLERFTGGQRAAILDACSSMACNIEGLQAACGRIVGDWQNVCDVNGSPLAYVVEEGGFKRNRFNEFMGALPLIMQLRVLVGIVEFVGIPREAITIPAIIESLEKLGGAAGRDGLPSPTSTPGATTSAAASGV